MHNKDIFNKIYARSSWGYKSGRGSEPLNAVTWTNAVNKFIGLDDVNSVLDLGCGDWRLGKTYNLADKKYLGVDVSSLIIEEISVNSNKNISFISEDIVSMDFEYHDLILIKDVLQHLCIDDIKTVMDKIMANCKYALICNDFSDNSNKDISNGEWRELDLNKHPFLYDLNEFDSWNIYTESQTFHKMIYLYQNKDNVGKVDR